MASQLKTICYVAGHSGGHIIPCISLAKELPLEYRPLFIASTKALDRQIIEAEYPAATFYTLPISQHRRSWQLPFFALSMIYSFLKALALLIKKRPLKIVTTGSVVAIPACIAAWLLRIKIELWELNAIPGNTVRFLASFATDIKLCFEETKKLLPRKSSIMPYPIRPVLTAACTPYWQSDFSQKRLTIFIQGGSQGSWSINTLILKTIEAHPDLKSAIQLIHQAGSQAKQLEKQYRKEDIPAKVFSYDHAVGPYYKTADVIICRSGAGSLFEAAHSGKPTITIPLIGTAQSHQLSNARAAIKQGLGDITLISEGDEASQKIYKYVQKRLLKRATLLTTSSPSITI